MGAGGRHPRHFFLSAVGWVFVICHSFLETATRLQVLKVSESAVAKLRSDGAALVESVDDRLFGIVRHLNLAFYRACYLFMFDDGDGVTKLEEGEGVRWRREVWALSRHVW